MAPLIEVKNLRKEFGPLVAVDDIGFAVEQGTVLGFLGPNGAGKSTTMKMITGFVTPTAGTIAVCGHDVADDPIAAKAAIGYLPEGAPAYPDMTPAAFLDFCAEVRGLGRAERKAGTERAVARLAIEGVLHQPIETLSKGFKRRVGLAQAILHDPKVLILDEPTDGLDPNQKHEVRELIRTMAKDKAIVISTHILEEVEAICTRAMIIASGRVAADGTPEELARRSRYHNAVALTLEGGAGLGAEAALRALPGVAAVEPQGEIDGRVAYAVLAAEGRPILDRVNELARRSGWRVDQLRVEPGRLDEVFRSVTAAAGARRS